MASSDPPAPAERRPWLGWAGLIALAFAGAAAIALVRGAFARRARQRRDDLRCEGPCQVAGLCGFDEKMRVCRARGPEDCRHAGTCKTIGACSYAAGRCETASDEECRASEQCKLAGRCHFSADPLVPCVPGGKDDCLGAQVCDRLGRCSVVGKACDVASAEDCARSDACRKNGFCSVKRRELPEGTVAACAALSDDDCKRGEACAKRGACTAVAGGCQ